MRQDTTPPHAREQADLWLIFREQLHGRVDAGGFVDEGPRRESIFGPPAMATGTQQPATTLAKLSGSPV